MKHQQARALATQIEQEAPGATVMIEPDELIPWCDDYHLQVAKTNVLQFVVRSTEQWNERKHLLLRSGQEERNL